MKIISKIFVLIYLTSIFSHADQHPYVQVSERDNRYFELDNGKPFIPIGLNMVGTWGETNKEGLQRMDGWMKALSENGGNFLRVWLSHKAWDIENKKSGEYDAEAAERIDKLFEMARKHNIYLKLTLEHFREVIPDTPYARKHSWTVKKLHYVKNGGTAKSMDDWFEGEASRDIYRRKLDWYAKRYGSDPIVFGWELWNEINAVRSSKHHPWTVEMLDELHKRFPRNMAMQSLGSFDRAINRKSYQRLVSIKANDVAQVHRYLDLGAQLEVCHGPVDILAADSVRELLAMNPGKPVLLAESGAVEPKHAGPFKLYSKDKAGIILHDVIFAPFFAGAAGCGQCWHWDKYVDRNKLWAQFKGFAETVKDIDPVKENFQASMIEHPRLRIYVLKGANTSLLWLRDKQNTWKTELAEGKTPKELKDQSIAMSDTGITCDAAIKAYDPWKNRCSDATVANGEIVIPPFKRSIVLKLTRE